MSTVIASIAVLVMAIVVALMTAVLLLVVAADAIVFAAAVLDLFVKFLFVFTFLRPTFHLGLSVGPYRWWRGSTQ